MVSFCTTNAQVIASIALAAPIVCPIMDFIELIARFMGLFPNTFLIEIVSALSLAGVPVPCALTYWTSSGLRFALFKAFFMAEIRSNSAQSGESRIGNFRKRIRATGKHHVHPSKFNQVIGISNCIITRSASSGDNRIRPLQTKLNSNISRDIITRMLQKQVWVDLIFTIFMPDIINLLQNLYFTRGCSNRDPNP